MLRHHLDDLVACYHADNLSARQETYNDDADLTLAELMQTIQQKSDNISRAVAEL